MSMIYCRGCGEEIHETAESCPHCGAPQKVDNKEDSDDKGDSSVAYSSYDDVPFYRKNWFAIFSFFFLAPVLILVLLTGTVYYESDDEVKPYSTSSRVIALIIMILFMGGVMAGGG